MEPSSLHKISVQLTALFGLVQPAVPLVECMVPGETEVFEEIRGKKGGHQVPGGH